MFQSLANKHASACAKLKGRVQRSRNALAVYHKRMVKEHKEMVQDVKEVMKKEGSS